MEGVSGYDSEIEQWFEGIGKQVVSANSEVVFADCLPSLLAFLQCERSAIVCFGRSKTESLCQDAYRDSKTTHYSNDYWLLDETSWSGLRLKGGEEVVLGCPDDLPEDASNESSMMTTQGVSASMALPLFCDGEVWGALCVERLGGDDAWSDRDLMIAKRLVSMLSLGLSKWQAEESRLQLQSRLDSVVDIVDDGVWCWDLKTDSIDADPSFFARFGYSEADWPRSYQEIVGLIHPEDSVVCIEELLTHFRDNNSVCSVEMRFRCHDGSYRWIQFRGRVMARDEDWLPRKALVALTDIHHQKESELVLKEAQAEADRAIKKAEEAYEVKGVFLANMSHEIRTPLTAISGLIALLERTDLDKKQRDYLTKMNISRELLLRIVNDTLDYSKIEAGKFTINHEVTDLRRLLIEVVTVIKMKFIDKGIDFELQVQRNIPRWVRCDDIRLKQVLMNLLFNAFKFTEKGKVALSVGAEVMGKQAEIYFSVKDTGIGISHEKQEKLFEAFYQVDGGLSRSYEGTGLGLSISNKLVDMMGGKLRVTSHENEGSDFNFSLGLEIAGVVNDFIGDLRLYDFDSVSSSLGAVESPTLKTKADSPHGLLNILVVDDNRLNREVFAGLISHLGFSVKTAKNGEDALEFIQSERFDLVMLDVMMPVMDGYETVEALQKKIPEKERPKILALTASTSTEVKAKCLAVGMDGFLVKPLEVSHLMEEIHRFFPDLFEEKESDPERQPVEFDPSIIPVFKTLDRERLLSLLFSKKDRDAFTFLESILSSYLKESSHLVQEIRSSNEKGDRETMKFHIHALGSASSTIGAFTLTEICIRVESRLNKDLSSNVKMFLEMIYREHSEISGEMDAFLAVS